MIKEKEIRKELNAYFEQLLRHMEQKAEIEIRSLNPSDGSTHIPIECSAITDEVMQILKF